MQILNDELFQTDTEVAKLCISNAKALVELLASPSVNDTTFIEEITSTLQQPIDKIRSKVDSEKMWTEFHKLRSTDAYSKKWRDYLSSINCQPNPAFYQHVTIELFEQILQGELQKLQEEMCPEADRNEVSITHDEENAIRYMAGYVLRKLKKKRHAVDGLIQKDREYIAETSSNEWIKLIDRGGLVHVTEECHQLFVSIELITRHHIHVANVQSMDEQFREHLFNMITVDDDVLFNWMMTGAEDEEVFNEMVKLWITIRGHSFAKSVMEKYKKKSKKITSKSKGLRTTLFTDQVQ